MKTTLMLRLIAVLIVRYHVNLEEAYDDGLGKVYIKAPYIPEGFIKELENTRPAHYTVEYDCNKNLIH